MRVPFPLEGETTKKAPDKTEPGIAARKNWHKYGKDVLRHVENAFTAEE